MTLATMEGIQVALPFGDRCRYDQIWDVNSKLYRIQVKTCRNYNDEYIIFSCRSSSKNTGKIKHKRYSVDEIDFFATVYNNKLYVVSVNECSIDKRLRFTTPKNNQKQQVSYASDYILNSNHIIFQ